MKVFTQPHRALRRISSFVFLLALVFNGFGISLASAEQITKAQCEAVAGQTCGASGLSGRTQTGDTCTYAQPSGAFSAGVCYKAVVTTACTALNPAGVCKSSCSANGDTAGNGTCSTGLCCVPIVQPSCTSLTPAGVCKAACGASEIGGNGTCGTGTCCVLKSADGGGYTPINNTVAFGNPLQYDTVQGVLGGLLSALQGIIVILSIIFIVIGAVLYITSGGNSKQIESAKSAITASMIGLALGIAAPAFLKEIATILGWKSVSSTLSCNIGTADDIAACNASKAALNSGISLTQILTNVLTFLTGVVGILSIIMLVIGALMILSSAGSEDRIDDGKKIVRYSVLGIIVAFAALIIVKQVAALFI